MMLRSLGVLVLLVYTVAIPTTRHHAEKSQARELLALSAQNNPWQLFNLLVGSGMSAMTCGTSMYEGCPYNIYQLSNATCVFTCVLPEAAAPTAPPINEWLLYGINVKSVSFKTSSDWSAGTTASSCQSSPCTGYLYEWFGSTGTRQCMFACQNSAQVPSWKP